MRIDVVTIFPDYLDPLRQSLPGKAIDAGIIELAVHDLRTWTHDVHRSVDDSPYGGGPGMVMKAPVWGEASTRSVRTKHFCSSRRPRVGCSPRPTPNDGAPRSTWCSHAAATRASTNASSTTRPRRMRVEEVSIGDYVLPGGSRRRWS